MSEIIGDDEALGIFVALALNDLYSRNSPCCPTCCWQCHVLQALSQRPDGPGSLNSILTYSPVPQVAFRDLEGNISREVLEKQWTQTSCHQEEEWSDESAAGPV